MHVRKKIEIGVPVFFKKRTKNTHLSVTDRNGDKIFSDLLLL